MGLAMKQPRPAQAKPGAPSKPRESAGRKPVELKLFDFTGVYSAAPIERIEWIRHGLDAVQVIKLAARLHTSQDQLMKLLGLPRATIVRKSKARQKLSTEQSERVIGLSKLIGQVQTMVEQSGNPAGFDAAHWVAQWLDLPNAALGGRKPSELMDTVAGQDLVSSILAKLQSGAYA